MNKVLVFFRMIKFEHSLFALPFALTGMLMAAEGWPDLQTIILIIIVMVSARTAAMALNRLIDADIDAKNKRTAMRDIPAGNISKKATLISIIISFIVYFVAVYFLNDLAFKLSPIPVIIFILYSYTKRFTNLCHFIIGLALAIAPIGAWVAVRGTITEEPILLGAGVLAWCTGFDILYAIQDIEFDRREGLFSIPASLGITWSLVITKILHTIAVIMFLLTGLAMKMGYIYYAGIIITAAFLIYEHSLISKNDLSRLNVAFFNMNAYISITIFVFTLIDILL